MANSFPNVLTDFRKQLFLCTGSVSQTCGAGTGCRNLIFHHPGSSHRNHMADANDVIAERVISAGTVIIGRRKMACEAIVGWRLSVSRELLECLRRRICQVYRPHRVGYGAVYIVAVWFH